MALLLLGVDLAGDGECGAAARDSDSAAPAVGALLRGQRERLPAGESHFTLRIESPAFAGKGRVERQRMIYATLGDLMDARVHALSIRATAPGE